MTNHTYQIKLKSGLHTYSDLGEAKKTLLLLHGFSFRQGLYPLVNILASDFRIILPDLPFSTKEYNSKADTLDEHVDFLLEFIQKLGLKRMSIFGNSVGGTLALLCGLKRPDQFEKLIVRCPLWSKKQLPGYLQIETLGNFHHYLSGSKRYAISAIKLFYFFSSRMSPVAQLDRDDKVPFKYGEIAPIVLSRFLGRLVEVEFEHQLQDIPNDTLILWGELDNFIQSRWGLRLKQFLPKSQYLEMKGEYHNIATADLHMLSKSILEFAR